MNRKFRIVCAALVAAALVSPTALALKHAEPEHNLNVDPTTPAWQPGKVPIPEDAKEVELNIVPDGGHLFSEPGVLDGLVRATDRFAGL